MHHSSKLAAAAVGSLLSLCGFAFAATAVQVSAPVVCDRGEDRQTMTFTIDVPATAVVGAKVSVRVQGGNSGKISRFGLNYVFDVMTDYVVPDGTRVVDGSVKIVPGTGTANVRTGATAWSDKSGLHLWLPAHVQEGTDFTPPAFEFQLEVTGAVGTRAQLALAEYRVRANAVIVGDVLTICTPSPKPYPLTSTRIVAAD